MLDKLNRAVHCHIIASGGVSSLLDIVSLYDLGLYGAIAGKSLYNRRPGPAAPPSSPATRFPAKTPPGICPEDELDPVLYQVRFAPRHHPGR